MPLGEVGQFKRGSSFQKKHFSPEGKGCIHYGQLYTHFGPYASETISFLDNDFAKGKTTALPGDLVIATTSENDEDVCKAVAWLGKEDVVVSNDALVFSHDLNPKYVSYWFGSAWFQGQKMPHITGTKVRRVSGNALAKLMIPVPSLKEQERIASILEKLDMLVNEVSQDLLAEIEARREQYKFYRDELLAFKEKAA